MSSQPASDQERAEFVRGLLWGTLKDGQLAAATDEHTIDRRRTYYAVRARPIGDGRMDELARAIGLGRPGSSGLGAVVDGDLVGFVTARPRHTTHGVSGWGPARPPARLHESFRMASRALQTAHRRGMTGMYDFGALGLLPAIMSDRAIGDALCHRLFAPLGDTEFADEIINTVRVYLAQGMHAPRTAKALCVHSNTVRYRIGRFEESSGVSLRRDRTATFEVLWALEYRAAFEAIAGR